MPTAMLIHVNSIARSMERQCSTMLNAMPLFLILILILILILPTPWIYLNTKMRA